MIPKIFLLLILSVVIGIYKLCEFTGMSTEDLRSTINLVFNIGFSVFLIFAVRYYIYVFMKSFNFEIEDTPDDMMGQNKAFLFGIFSGWQVAKYQWTVQKKQ